VTDKRTSVQGGEITKVALTQGENREDSVSKALDLIKNEVLESIEKVAGEKSINIEELTILVKPNFVCAYRPLSLTSVDAVRATLDFFKDIFPQTILVAEGSGSCRNTMEVFDRYGYRSLESEFNVKLFDLNADDFEVLKVFDEHLEKDIEVKYSKTCLHADYIISVSPPKTHEEAVVTLSWKNILQGCPVWQDEVNEKTKLHHGALVLQKSLAEIGKKLYPHLAILDGWEAMEGNGPCLGTSVDWKIAIASTDFLAADIFCADLMGVSLDCVEYLKLAAKAGLGESDIKKMEIVGNIKPEEIRRKFKLPPGISC